MVLDKSRERKEDFVLDGENIEEVESFTYLGSLINIKGRGCTGNQKAASDGSRSSAEHGVYMEEQRYELGTQSEDP